MSDISFRPLDENEHADLAHRLVRVRELAATVGIKLSADGNEADLEALNILSSGLKWPDHESAIILIALAFGQILTSAAPFSWGKVDDEWGTETSLKLDGYEFYVHPISMVIKRIQRGEPVDFRYLFDDLTRRVRTMDPNIQHSPD